MPTKTQLINGNFQDTEGNALASGYLVFKLNQDENISGSSICAGIEVTVTLDSSGNVAVSPAQSIWATDIMSPVNAYYTVSGYTEQGLLAWGPNNQQVTSGGVGGGTFDLDTWIPNEVFSWTPPLQPLRLQVNSVANVIQTLQNLVQGPNITITDNGDGSVTIAAASGGTSLQGVSVSNAVPRTGDTFRYNEYGDSQWDIVNGYPLAFRMVSTLFGTGYDVNLTGAGTTPTTVGTQAGTAATATEPRMQNASATAAGSVNLATGVLWPNGGAAAISFGIIRRWQARCRLNNTSSIRYWVGLSEFVATIASSAWASDTPNMNYAAFRFSAGTDTTIKAVAGTSNVAQTVVDTGISVDTTNSQLFEIVQDATHVYYYINGALVATITTTVPPRTTLMLGSIVGDNKNTATAMSQDTAHMIFTVK